MPRLNLMRLLAAGLAGIAISGQAAEPADSFKALATYQAILDKNSGTLSTPGRLNGST